MSQEHATSEALDRLLDEIEGTHSSLSLDSLGGGGLAVLTRATAGNHRRLGTLDVKADRLDTKVDRLDFKVDRLDDRVERLDSMVHRIEIKTTFGLENKIDNGFDGVDRRFDTVEAQLRQLTDDVRKIQASIERLAGVAR